MKKLRSILLNSEILLIFLFKSVEVNLLLALWVLFVIKISYKSYKHVSSL